MEAMGEAHPQRYQTQPQAVPAVILAMVAKAQTRERTTLRQDQVVELEAGDSVPLMGTI
jgi:hypothetical protein